MTEKQAIRKTLSYYKKMLKWAKRQNQREKCDETKMLNEIKVSWYSEYCNLCSKYDYYHFLLNGCMYACPLGKKYGPCLFANRKNAWGAMAKAKTWKGFVYHIQRGIKQLESLLD